MTSGQPTNYWHEKDIGLLKRLVEDNTSNADIAERLGRSVMSVKAKISRLAMPTRIRARTSWTSEASKHLLVLRDEMGLGWTEIGKRLNRAGSSCHTHYYILKNPTVAHVVVQRAPICSRTVEEWRRRQSLSPRTLTAAFFGDPLPGCSALDRRAP